MLSTIVHHPRETHQYSVICLHGLGANGQDLAPLAETLALPGVRFVFPNAPVMPITVNQGMPMPAWYDIDHLDFNRRIGAPDLADAVASIHALIAEEKRQFDRSSEAIFLMGFSQGGAMAVEVGLHYPEPLAGIVTLSGYAPKGEHSFLQLASANQATPIFQAHGKYDDIVPQFAGEILKDQFREFGYHAVWKSYRMGHEICAAELADLKAWFFQQIKSTDHH